MNEDREFEMRDEYDFSGGVRGRHAARLTPQERSKLLREAAIRDAQAWRDALAEDAALARAIQEGEDSEAVSRDEVFRILDAAE